MIENFINTHLLTSTVFLPLVGAALILALPPRWRRAIWSIALLSSLGALGLGVLVFVRVGGQGEFALTEIHSWIPSLNIRYHLGADGASALLILLVTFLVPMAMLASLPEIKKRIKLFCALLLVMEAGLIGVFSSLNVFLFYIFWELVLIPMCFVIGIWGSGDRRVIAIKYLLFIMAGSVLMLVAIIYCGVRVGSFDLIDWYAHRFGITEQLWLFAAFGLAFAIKVPLMGVHSWLPDAHAEAPTAGSVLLAGVLLKMGAYGFFRLALPLFPAAVVHFQTPLFILAVVGILAGALLALAQTDIKRLIAYSSVSHMGFVMLGLAALTRTSVAGALVLIVAHGLITGALFIFAGALYSRAHTRAIASFGGVARVAPMLSAFFIIMALASLGLPGLANFAGEFLILLGAFQVHTVLAGIGVGGVILSAGYMLWLVHRVFFGPTTPKTQERFADLGIREYAIIIPMVALVVAIGVAPHLLIDRVNKSAGVLVRLAGRTEHIAAVDEAKRDVTLSEAKGPKGSRGSFTSFRMTD
jgi:NADH-quinone oxidoreductase subunit M